MSDTAEASQFQYHGALLSIVERVSLAARKKMLNRLLQAAHPTDATSVLDIGVTSDARLDSNFFESHYPYPNKITAVGLEDASFLEERHPGLRFVQADALSLPFHDKSFNLVVSFAVIEHVGNRFRQQQFLTEACRVGQHVFVTTPNRYYPIEFHTILPLLHWLPPQQFRKILNLIGQKFFAKEENLNLLTEKELLSMVPANCKVTKLNQKLLGITSNLVLYIET